MNKSLTVIAFALSWSLMPLAGTAEDLPKDPDAGEPPEYCVVCPDGAAVAEACEVDKPTYIGWRSFQLHCFQCHGPGGIGTTFGPGLIDLMNQHVDYGRFWYVMKHGFTGRIGAMPTFEKNNAALKDTDDIYRYLRARADGVLPIGRPKRLTTPDCPATALAAPSKPPAEPQAGSAPAAAATTPGAPPAEPQAASEPATEATPSAPAAEPATATEGSPRVSGGVDATWLKQLKSRLLVVESVLRDIKAQVDALEQTTAGAAEPAAATEPAAEGDAATETPTPTTPPAEPQAERAPATEPLMSSAPAIEPTEGEPGTETPEQAQNRGDASP